MTYDLFSSLTETSGACRRLDLPDADVLHYAALFSSSEAEEFFTQLRYGIAWRQEAITVYGRVHAVPRLTAWYGDHGKTYTYSGLTSQPLPWVPVLLEIKERIESVSGAPFNCVLLNLYRDGSDSVSWHADDEQELGINPVIGSVSFGESRVFQMKHRKKPACRQNVVLESGSFLLMRGPTQHHWLHQVPKSVRPLRERINLTFRVVY